MTAILVVIHVGRLLVFVGLDNLKDNGFKRAFYMDMDTI
jgi:hypothetical protein